MKSKPNAKSATAVDEYIGARIRGARIEMKMSQTELGDEIGVTFQQIQKYEKGMNRVTAANLIMMSRALRREVSWFFNGAPGVDQKSFVARPDLAAKVLATPHGAALIEAFLSIDSNQDRLLVSEVARRFARPDKPKLKAVS